MNAVCFFSTFETPVGPFSVAVNESGELVATAFGDATVLQKRTRAARWQPDEADRTKNVGLQVREYFDGSRAQFDLPLLPEGTAFQRRVWTALQAIPFGQTASYGALARQLGTAARAIGRANALNPICLIVPCHRVIGADGSLTGFAFGEVIKRELLAHEARRADGSYLLAEMAAPLV